MTTLAAKNASIDIRRAGERFHSRIDWLDSWHSFSFGQHYDAANTGHGLLIVSNDDVIAPGAGFGMHGHRDMEIVSWVLEGELAHKDSVGNNGRIGPGKIQAMSAGRGIRHSEMNPDPERAARLVQMWVLPERPNLEPGYDEKDVTGLLDAGGFVAVASGKGHPGAIVIHQPAAVLWVARLKPGETVTLPGSAYGHLFVCTGAATLEGGYDLKKGDAARLTGSGPLALTNACEGVTEILHWEMDAAASPE